MKKTITPIPSLKLSASALCTLYAAALLSSGGAHAAGFALNEMSAASLGTAFAGSAATAEDLGTIYYNPAGLSRMSGRQFMATGSAIRPSIDFDNLGTLSAAGTPATGGEGGDAGSWALVPALYYATDLSPGLRFGIGVQVPFGLKTEYDADWVGRYQAIKSELKTININPSISYKVNEQLSVGAGISAQYAEVELTRAIDFGAVCVARLGPGVCAPIGFLPQARDGRVKLTGDDWAYGFNFGLLFTPAENIRLGLAYRSRIKHEFGGDARFTTPAGLPAPLAAAPAFTSNGASADLDLPEQLNLSAHMDLDSKWAVMGDINWTRWSRFEELRVRFENGAADSVIREEWRNTVRVGLGTTYRYNDAWKLRGGISYERSPVRNEHRTPSVPDSHRKMLAFGAQYKPDAGSSWDFGYAHIFVNDASIDSTEPAGSGRLIGRYENNVNILSVQYNRAF